MSDIVKLAQESNKLSAIIVESNKLETESLKVTFESFFNNISTTSNIEDTLNICTVAEPDVIFLDLDTSDIDEAELSQKIYKINPNQIIVVISSNQDIQKISELLQVGIASLIQKPLDTQKTHNVLNTISKIISKKKKIEIKTFSISLPIDIYEMIHNSAKSENISKNAIVIRGLRDFFLK